MIIAGYLAVAVYFAIMFLIGLIASRHIKNETDFLLAGRKNGLIFLTFTLAATHFGGGFVMGGIEYGMLYGLSGMWYGLACGIGLLLLSSISSKLRGLSLFTAPEYLEKRYKSRFVRVYATATSLLAIVGITAAQIIATKRLLSLFGISSVVASIIATMIFIAYTYFGGMWAVTITDFFQLSLAAIGVVALSIFASGFDFSNVSTVINTTGSLGPLAVVGIVLPTVMYTLIGQDFYQRLFSAKNKKIARNGSILGGVLLCVLSIFPAILGISLLNYGSDFNGALASFLNTVPTVLALIFIVSVLGAIMSTADSLLSAASSHIVKDLMEDLFKIKERELFYSRMSVIGIGFLALVLSFALPTIIDALVFSYTIYTAAIFFPLVLGIFWKGGRKEGAIVSMVVSSIVVIFGYFFNPFGIPLEISGALFSVVLFVTFSLIYRKRSTEKRPA